MKKRILTCPPPEHTATPPSPASRRAALLQAREIAREVARYRLQLEAAVAAGHTVVVDVGVVACLEDVLHKIEDLQAELRAGRDGPKPRRLN